MKIKAIGTHGRKTDVNEEDAQRKPGCEYILNLKISFAVMIPALHQDEHQNLMQSGNAGIYYEKNKKDLKNI